MSQPRRIVDLVFAERRARSRRRIVVAAAATACLYALVALWFWSIEAPLADWGAELALRVHAELSREQMVELAPPPEKPPPPVAAPRPAPPSSPSPSIRQARSSPPPPAKAGSVVAREAEPAAPVDLSGNTFIVGSASAYVGGVTASSGTNTQPVRTQTVDPRAPPGAGAPDRSSPATPSDADWRCPWPAEADDAQIDEQVAVIRVVINTDGSLASARVVMDPGHGFGQAALACAKRARFSPARDRDGHTIRAESPPIRVRFIR